MFKILSEESKIYPFIYYKIETSFFYIRAYVKKYSTDFSAVFSYELTESQEKF